MLWLWSFYCKRRIPINISLLCPKLISVWLIADILLCILYFNDLFLTLGHPIVLSQNDCYISVMIWNWGKINYIIQIFLNYLMCRKLFLLTTLFWDWKLIGIYLLRLTCILKIFLDKIGLNRLYISDSFLRNSSPDFNPQNNAYNKIYSLKSHKIDHQVFYIHQNF